MIPPGRIDFTWAAVTRTGAFLPGMSAVVMTTSAFEMRSETSSACFFLYSSDCSAAYPPAPCLISTPVTWRNFPPRLSTCSFVSGRTSVASTTAPRRFAVPIAWRPATPAPKTRTRAGVIVPAAVMSIGKNRGSRSAAMRTALYPARFACDESASIDCASVVRGIMSTEIAPALRPAIARTRSALIRG
jgi:hypothetical protein